MLAEAVVSAVATTGKPTGPFIGYAFRDPRWDELITSRDAFAPALAEVSQLSLVQERFGGGDEPRRLVLQFAYEVFKRCKESKFSEDAFEGTWAAFASELENPEWVYRAIANLRNFRCDKYQVPMGDGVSAFGRDFASLKRLGFDDGILTRISEDWMGFGASSFVVLVEQRVRKTPGNVVLGNDASIWLNAQRGLGALRLLAPGDVAMGPMWVVRPSAFELGVSGGQLGASIPSIGSEYVLTEEVAAAVPGVYAELEHLERVGYGAAPGNLDLALRSFMATYDRWPPGNDSRLIDAVTAIEAVLGTEAEISFKLAFRVASLLASTDGERAALLDELKAFYDTRSRLVHGGQLKKKHHETLKNVDVLRGRVRRLLRSLVSLAIRGPGKYTERFFHEDLDAALVNASEREAIRRALRLDVPT